MNSPNPAVIFLLGLVGALAPEVIRLYKLRSSRAAFSWSWFYVVISIVFGVLGGTVAVILPATTHLAAFYAGVSTPLIISTILRNAGAGQMDPADIESTRAEIKKRARMSRSEKAVQTARDEKGTIGGSVDAGFLSRKQQLLMHDYLNSL